MITQTRSRNTEQPPIPIDSSTLAETIKRMENWNPRHIQERLETAAELIPELAQYAHELTINLCSDRHDCILLGIDYLNPNTRLVKAALADYLVKK